MCDKECVPAVYKQKNRRGQIAKRSRAMQIAREELTKRDGPPPFPDAVCRHLCENDSTGPNGFICIIHTEWAEQSENIKDQGENQSGRKNCAIERTCPYCGRTIKGPGYFIHERACHRRLQVSLLPNDAGL